MKKYLDKHMKRCLSKEEREAMFKEPDLQSCNPPKVDKYMSEFLGKRLPKEHDAELAKIQAAILAGVRPLTSAWQLLLLGKRPRNGSTSCRGTNPDTVHNMHAGKCF